MAETATTEARDFEQILASPTLTYEEGLRFFRGTSMVNETLKRLAADLEARSIEYSVIDAVALKQRGYRRFAEVIDILLTREGLEKFQKELARRGYRPTFPGATKKFRATKRNVPSKSSQPVNTPAMGSQRRFGSLIRMTAMR
jgi:hypothetical protein